ncbi:ATP-dependent DNA ligase [Candidatus Roseilinea sp. NK_OTU-006]|uniref:ATP-dependent DNA ligase n=1 Tax=Candidatus Roseilinea sp. NK_OTU-006 TaxID=2704250 RepID=UPI00403D94F8
MLEQTMRDFAVLYADLDATNKTNEKVAAMVRYLRSAPPADAAWAIYFLIGRRPRQAVSATHLRAWAAEAAGIADWLFEECYAAVGDLAETMALLDVRASSRASHSLSEWVEGVLLPLREMDEPDKKCVVLRAWASLDSRERFVWNKLITGAFRVGVSQKLVVRALAEVSGVDEATLSHRLMGEWQPSADFFAQLIAPETADADISRPYPFCLAYALESKLPTDARGRLFDADPVAFAGTLQAALGDLSDWQAEWKWDGIRAQLIRRRGQTFLWSRGEELITARFPEIAAIGAALPDGVVLDGEILPFKDGRVLPFGRLQTRIGRKTLTKKILAEAPVVLFAYDLLELDGQDVRSRPLRWRRAQLAQLVEACRLPTLKLSPIVAAESWEALERRQQCSRAHDAEGLMLKRLDSSYGVGRIVGDWWKWKVAPYTADAVLVYAQAGHGRRAGLFTDYTFAVWDGDPRNGGRLVPFAKAYSGLTDAEMRRVDAFIRANTLEKFGPVRTVKPQLVFELGFEGIQRSARHKSGIAVRFPRILRLRDDKRIEDADTLETIRALLPIEPEA